MNHSNPYSSPQSHESVAEEAEQQGVSWRARGLSSLLGGFIGMLVGGLCSVGGLSAHFSGSMSVERWIVINILSLTCTGLMVGTSPGASRPVRRLSWPTCASLFLALPIGQFCGAACGIALAVLVMGADQRSSWWIGCFGMFGWWVGLVIGYIFSLIRLIVWWIR
jgi:hypothetical protein